MSQQLSVLIAGGTGTIGRSLQELLRAQGHNVAILTRGSTSLTTSVPLFSWAPGSVVDLDKISQQWGHRIDAVVNLSGSSISQIPWTKGRKKNILSSRIDSTTTLVDAIVGAQQKPKMFVSGSAVGFYGNRGDEHLTESSSAGSGFLTDVVVAWEDCARPAKKVCSVAFIRTGLVLDQKGALAPLKLLTRFFLSGPLAGGKAWWPWISLHDEVRAIEFILTHELNGPINLVGPHPATSGTLMSALAKLMKRPYWFPAPGFAISLVLGQAGKELLLSSQHISPDLLTKAGFVFDDKDVTSALTRALR
jgi:uncharacterized protein (TIGR01777 family)